MLVGRRSRRCLQAPPWLDLGFALRDRVARQHRPTVRRVGTLVNERRICRFHRCCRVPVGLLTVLTVLGHPSCDLPRSPLKGSAFLSTFVNLNLGFFAFFGCVIDVRHRHVFGSRGPVDSFHREDGCSSRILRCSAPGLAPLLGPRAHDPHHRTTQPLTLSLLTSFALAFPRSPVSPTHPPSSIRPPSPNHAHHSPPRLRVDGHGRPVAAVPHPWRLLRRRCGGCADPRDALRV